MTKEKLLQILLQAINKISAVTIEQNDFGKDMTTLGIDSLDAIEIANEMEEALDIIIDDRDIVNFRSINMILAYFEKVNKNR